MASLPDRSEVERFRAVIGQKLGLHVDEGRLDQLADLLRQRLTAGGHPRLEGYLQRLASGAGLAEEIRALAEQLTVSETFFFRNSDHFRALTQLVLPERIRRQGGTQRRLRLLSAGCASGEEPYSLAILVREALPDLATWDIKIIAIDINPANLARAAQGRYTSWSLRATPDDVRRRWFHEDGRDFVLDSAVRKMVTFEERNLVVDDPRYWQSLGCDVVLCRNVLMYFRPEALLDVVHRLGQATLPGGFLFMGHAETLRGFAQDFHLRHTHETFYYQRLEVWERPVALPALNAGAVIDAGSPAAREKPVSWIDVIARASDRIASLASDRSRPAAVPPIEPSPAGAAAPPGRNGSWNLAGVMETMRQERFAAAREQLAALPPDSHRSPDALLLGAVLLTNEGRLPEAEAACRQLLALDELNAGAHYLMALAREQVGDHPGAVGHDQTAMYLDPAFAMPHLHLGLMLRRQGEQTVARSELGQAVVLLAREDASRLLLFGGGFSREALIELCRRQLTAPGVDGVA
jgi:chemotaxis protein methyltransferase CheR